MNYLTLLCVCFFSSFPILTNAKMTYQFTNDPIDVVIPSVEKDLDTLNLCIRGIKENGIGIRRIIVVSKKQFTDEAEWFSEENYPFSFQDVAEALSNNNSETKEALLEKGGRAGWYYQQLLKLYAPLVIPDISPNVLVLDSDTIFLHPVAFLNNNNAGLYNFGAEYHIPYFEHGGRLLPGFYKCFPQYSGICHHMLIQKPVIEELFNQVERNHSASFWESFCHLVDPKSLFESGASEYEIYFNYIFSTTDQVSIRKLYWKNITTFKEIAISKKRGLDYVSLHTYHREKE